LRISFYLFIFLFCFQFSYAQSANHELYISKINEIGSDSLLSLIDHELLNLKPSKNDVNLQIDLLKIKLAIADSSNNTFASLEAYESLLAYSSHFPLITQYKYARKAHDYQLKIGNSDKAIQHLLNFTLIAEKETNDSLLALTYQRLGTTYKSIGNPDLSIKYLERGISLFEKIENEVGVMNCYMTLGNAYKASSKNDTAIFYYQKSIQLAEKLGDKKTIAGNYNNWGSAFRNQERYEESLAFFFKAVKINKEMGNETWLSYNYNNIASTYENLNKTDLAIKYANMSLEIKDRLGDESSKISTYKTLSNLYYKIGNYKKAIDYLRLENNLSKQFVSMEKSELAAELEAKFQSERKEALINQLVAEQDLQNLTIESQKKDLAFQDELRKKEKNLIYALAFVLLSMIIIILILWRTGNERKKHTNELTIKNEKIEQANVSIRQVQENLVQKNKEITDSINYAKRIQAAILPSKRRMENILTDGQVLYLPKDIVAGDFYWTEKIGDTLLFAVADCTGHGVPGAMVSVICHNALNAAVNQEKKLDPGAILDETNKLVIQQFEKSEEAVRDGMDIALCTYNNRTQTLKFAGANIPLRLLKSSGLVEHSANRQPIGKYAEHVPFKTQTINFEIGDTLYLLTDGYCDQFGGPNGKKFMNKRFRELLTTFKNMNIEEQIAALEANFKAWKSTLEQVDDVCVMAIRLDD
jgi:serine phosphatase RsbU (regulator of sigma subunit)